MEGSVVDLKQERVGSIPSIDALSQQHSVCLELASLEFGCNEKMIPHTLCIIHKHTDEIQL